MTLKNAALLALVGIVLMTVLLVWSFVSNVLNVLRGVEAPVVIFARTVGRVNKHGDKEKLRRSGKRSPNLPNGTHMLRHWRR
jgi:hypothetical protein